MKEVILNVDGMMCGMCEAHVNDAIRKAINPKKVESSHKKNTTRVVCDDSIDVNIIKDVITKMGYKVNSISEVPYQKKGLFR